MYLIAHTSSHKSYHQGRRKSIGSEDIGSLSKGRHDDDAWSARGLRRRRSVTNRRWRHFLILLTQYACLNARNTWRNGGGGAMLVTLRIILIRWQPKKITTTTTTTTVAATAETTTTAYGFFTTTCGRLGPIGSHNDWESWFRLISGWVDLIVDRRRFGRWSRVKLLLVLCWETRNANYSKWIEQVNE